MYEQILVPTDGSDVAETAIDHAVDLAERYDATVHALYVVDTDAVSYALGTEQMDRIRHGSFDGLPEVRERAERATGLVAERVADRVQTKQHHVGGKPHREIAAYAADNDIDLIVMGSHGRAGVRRALLGSVTERTLRATNVPVLVVDHDGDEEE